MFKYLNRKSPHLFESYMIQFQLSILLSKVGLRNSVPDEDLEKYSEMIRKLSINKSKFEPEYELLKQEHQEK